jgi:hypothetical protein
MLEVESTHGAAGRIISVKNSSDIANRTRDFPAGSAVPQSTAPPYIFFSVTQPKLISNMILYITIYTFGT